jgi:hypothetical protein
VPKVPLAKMTLRVSVEIPIFGKVTGQQTLSDLQPRR